MGTNGVNTITALKDATGIADNRLSAHAPTGAGARTGFRDFHILKIGGLADGDERDPAGNFTTDLRLGNSTSVSTDSYVKKGDFLAVQFSAKKPSGEDGRYWGESVAVQAGIVQDLTTHLSLDSRFVNYEASELVEIYYKYEVTGFDYVDLELRHVEDVNEDATNHDTTLRFDSRNRALNVWSDAPRIEAATVSDRCNDSLDSEVDLSIYDPTDQEGNYYEYKVKPGQRDGDTGSSTSTNFSYTSPCETTYDILLQWYDGSGGTLVDEITVTAEQDNTVSKNPHA